MRVSTMFFLTVVITAGAQLAGCGSSNGNSSTSATGTAGARTPAAAATPVLNVAKDASGKQFLTDPSGRTLYVFSDDEPTVSHCTDSCAQTWLPLLVPAQRIPQPPGLPKLFGDFRRPDSTSGAQQGTYGGKPLYRYSGDTAPGQTNGDGIDGKWSIARP